MADIPAPLALVPQLDGCALWRVCWPYNAVQANGFHCGYALGDDPRAAVAAAGYDAIIFQRTAWTDITVGRASIDGLHRAGKLVFQECDDDMWVSRLDQKSHAELGIDKPEATPEQNRESTRLYDGVIVSTEHLRSVVHTFAPAMPVEVVPNAIDLDYWARGLAGWKRNLAGVTTIGWAGGDRRDRDFAVLAEAWRQVAAAHPDVHFVIMGHQPAPLVAAIPPERYHPISWMPFQSDGQAPFYGVGLAEIDIMCCTVAETIFNAAKSPIKLWEASASGCAIVGTSWLYGSSIDHGKDGYVADTVEEWVWALGKLAGSVGRRRHVARAMQRKVKERWSIEANWWRHPAAWGRLAEAASKRVRVELPGGVFA